MTAGHILSRLQPLFALLIFEHLSASEDDFESHDSVSSCTRLELIAGRDHETRRILNAVSSNSLSSVEKSKIQLDLV